MDQKNENEAFDEREESIIKIGRLTFTKFTVFLSVFLAEKLIHWFPGPPLMNSVFRMIRWFIPLVTWLSTNPLIPFWSPALTALMTLCKKHGEKYINPVTKQTHSICSTQCVAAMLDGRANPFLRVRCLNDYIYIQLLIIHQLDCPPIPLSSVYCTRNDTQRASDFVAYRRPYNQRNSHLSSLLGPGKITFISYCSYNPRLCLLSFKCASTN